LVIYPKFIAVIGLEMWDAHELHGLFEKKGK
jgi:hypothetical protein